MGSSAKKLTLFINGSCSYETSLSSIVIGSHMFVMHKFGPNLKALREKSFLTHKIMVKDYLAIGPKNDLA